LEGFFLQTNVVSNLDENFCRLIVRCMHDAWGDRTKEIVSKNQLKTQNSVPFLRWDTLCTSLCDEFNSPACMTYLSNRGAWKLPLLLDTESGVLITFMRESRFKKLRKEYFGRKKMHYIDLLSHYLNNDLQADTQQLELPLFNNFQKKFEDENKIPEFVRKFLYQLLEDDRQLKRHVLVLFDNSGYDVTSVRAVVIDKAMNVVYEENWNKFIPTDMSVIADEIVDKNDVNNDPRHGLKFTAKSNKRKNRKYNIINSKTDNAPETSSKS